MCLFPPSSSSLILIFSLFFLLHSPSVAYNEPCYNYAANGTCEELHYHRCGNGNYTANSTYETNLKRLLSSLISNSYLPAGFSNQTIGQVPNEIYGLAVCRGDTRPSLCDLCLDAAFQDIVRLCPYSVKAIVVYDQCLIRYSNISFLATTKESENILKSSPDNITTDLPVFEKLQSQLLSTIADWAAYNTTMKFATGEVNFSTDFRTMRRRILQVRCFLRYEVYPFFEGASMIKLRSQAPAPAPAPLVPPSANPAREKGNMKNVTGIVLKIAIPLVSLSLPISITCICFWMKRKSAKSLVLDEANLQEITHDETLLLDLSMLRAATANFSEENKLGAGGFGAVYKGTLPNGQEFAAKRLSTTSRQGLAELKNELVLVAKLRHKNLMAKLPTTKLLNIDPLMAKLSIAKPPMTKLMIAEHPMSKFSITKSQMASNGQALDGHAFDGHG
ncbi:putative Cysteine-rich receptor-like protein kinase 25 [Cocos nucifera]|uniref:Putative Cysteine-rich receptor-like protein kinase 25 n=1 Tax=Cocos nucifera TaxID=13894 RepID=A0A8K0MXA6_COCNU|nr:putative Cysteine-rich receptor-like protein kinase 25 [Cocos nucifera]